MTTNGINYPDDDLASDPMDEVTEEELDEEMAKLDDDTGEPDV